MYVCMLGHLILIAENNITSHEYEVINQLKTVSIVLVPSNKNLNFMGGFRTEH